jgi:hypothetical protein
VLQREFIDMNQLVVAQCIERCIGGTLNEFDWLHIAHFWCPFVFLMFLSCSDWLLLYTMLAKIASIRLCFIYIFLYSVPRQPAVHFPV